jgi:hypothetical protein
LQPLPRMGSQFVGRGDPRASLRSHGLPGRQDVERRIEVGVGVIPAGCALEYRLALAVALCAVLALRACLRGEGRVHGHEACAGSPALVSKHPSEIAQALGQHAAVELRLPSNVASRLLDCACGRGRHAGKRGWQFNRYSPG